MRPDDLLTGGRASFARRAWGDAFVALAAADGEVQLEAEDLERLAVAASLTGRDADSAEAWARAHHQWLLASQIERAARCAFWLAFGFLNNGDIAQASGWLARAQRLLGPDHPDCVEQGYLLLPVARQCGDQGDYATASALFEQAADVGERFRDADLTTLARMGLGWVAIRSGASAEGVALLDEAMVAVTSDEVSPAIVGLVYCVVIAACHEIFDLRRAQEWTVALSDWCASQPDAVPYRGQCLVHRAQIMELHGAWQEALEEVARACRLLSGGRGRFGVGDAFYEQGELHRLRGEFAKAEEAYQLASRWGRKPLPGLALLRQEQGQGDGARAAIRLAVEEADDSAMRMRVLAACVDIMLAGGDVGTARAASNELTAVATDLATPWLRAVADQASGAVLRAEGDIRSARVVLRRAWAAWRELDAPYEVARVHVLSGLCSRELGDHDTATMELEAARLAFEQLGALPDLARVAALSGERSAPTPGGLTARETEVLRLIASGKTNRAIADALVISEKTVARHVANIFAKLAISSRSAATAFAYEHNLR